VNHWFPFIERYGVVARTSLKTDLLRLVLDRLMLLVVSSMKGMDTACVTGERGGGKTHTLRLLTRAIADEFPDKVLPVYIDYSKYTTMADPVPLPSTLIEVALAQRGYRTEEPMGMMVALDIISKLDLRLVLFVDEFETLFQHHKDVTPSALRIASFNAVESELNAIGNEQTGRCVAYLCGSSGSLPELISCRRNNAQLVTLYPMLQYAIDLNGSKYPQVHLSGAWHRDEQQFIGMVQALTDSNRVITPEGARALVVMYGCNLRMITKAVGKGSGSVQFKYHWHVRAAEDKRKYQDIIAAIDVRMVEVNSELLKKLKAAIRSGSLASVNTFDLRGIPAEEVMRLIGVENMPALDLLCDRSWYAGTAHCAGGTLYPASALTLLMECDPDTASDSAFRATVTEWGTKLLSAGFDVFLDSAREVATEQATEAMREAATYLRNASGKPRE
jgi:hypothetical protein